MSFLKELMESDWLGRDEETYVYKSTNHRIGWEHTLDKGSAYSSFVLDIGNRQLTAQRKVSMLHYLCSAFIRNMNPTKKPIKLNFSHSESFTDVDSFITVNISSMVTSEVDFPTLNHRIDPVLGFVIHEMAHVLYTDNETIQGWLTKYRKNPLKHRLMATIYNVIEDERIENKIAQHYTGYARYLEKAKDYIFSRRDDTIVPKNPVQELFGEFCLMLRFPRQMDEVTVNTYEKELRHIKDILTPYPDTSEDLIGCCEEIFKVFEKFLEEEKAKAKAESSSGGSGEGEKIEEESDGSDNPSDDTPNGGDAGGDITNPDEEGDSGEDEEVEKDPIEELVEMLGDILKEVEKLGNQGMNEGEMETTLKELVDSSKGFGSINDVMEVINDANKTLENPDPTKEVSTSDSINFKDMFELGSGQLRSVWQKVEAKPKDHDPYSRMFGSAETAYAESYDRVSQYASSLRGKIMQLNRAMDITHTNLAEGEFNHDDLVPALIGSKNVYQEKHRMLNRGAILGLLVDESGSMGASANNGQARYEVARDVAVMFELATRGVNNMDFYCFGHTTPYSPIGNEEATLMRSFFEGRRKGDPKALGNIRALSGNCDGHSVLETVARIRKTEPNLPIVLFVVSDGLPTDGVPEGHTAVSFNRAAIELVRKRYNCICIHLAVIDVTKHYEGVFDITVNLQDTTQYIQEIGTVLRKVMLKQQQPIII